MQLLILAAVLFAAPQASFHAEEVFNSGELYLRTTGTAEESNYIRNRATGIPEYPENRENSGTRYCRDIELWNSTMLSLWNSVNTSETFFTVRAGEEYLIYETFFLFYLSSEERVQIAVHPEELWRILSTLKKPGPALESQVSIEGWYSGLAEHSQVFIGQSDPAFETVQLLLERGREATLQQ